MSTIPFHSIDRTDRQRENYEPSHIQQLAESLYTYGFIHPICINPDTNRLIAGGCRSTALQFILDHTDDFKEMELHPTMVSFLSDGLLHEGIHFTTKTTDSEQEHQTLELIENVQRKQLSWQEETLAIAKIHRLKVAEAASKHDRWTQKRTASLLGLSTASMSYAFTLARELQDRSSPLWNASGMVDALQMLAKRQHDEANKLLVERIKQRATTVPTIQPSGTIPNSPAFIQSFDPSKFVAGGIAEVDMGAEFETPGSSSVLPTTLRQTNGPNPVAKTLSIIEQDQVQSAYDVVSKLIHHMSFEDFCEQMPEGFCDHILCDPPYAIEMDNIAQTGTGQKDIDRVADTHDVAENMRDFPVWLRGCYKILKPKGFCVWFCDQAQWQYLYDLAIKTGFKVQRWPFTWVKTSACSNQRAEYNFTKATEIAMVMRKGDARLIKQQPNNYWLGALTPEDKAAGVNHPFIKPMLLWQHLLAAIALPGSTIVDGFSGVGSSTRAMMLAGYTPIGVEKEEVHYAQQVQNLTKVYCELNGIQFK